MDKIATEILILLNNKKTTLKQIMEFLQQIVEEFQEERAFFYGNKLKRELKSRTEFDLDEHIQQILKLVESDTEQFIAKLTSFLTDSTLDSLSAKTLNKTAGHNFLVILTSLKDMFCKPQNKS